MNSHPKILLVPLLAAALCLAATACRTKSALDRALAERARWTVLALDWTQNKEQVVLLSTRVNGPSNSSLERLTVRIVLQGAAGSATEEIWHTFDLSELPRGGPKDITVRIEAEGPVDGLGVDRLPNPTERERAHIEELAGLR